MGGQYSYKKKTPDFEPPSTTTTTTTTTPVCTERED